MPVEQDLAERGLRRAKRPPRDVGSTLAGRAGHDQLVALGSRSEQEASIHQRAPALDDQLEDSVDVGLAADRAGDRDSRLEPADGSLELAAPASMSS